jgi:nucleoside-diphosphate-sugar epimerase
MDERDADPLTAYRRVNVEGTRKLLEAARNAGISRFVFVSTIKVLGEDTASGSVVTQDSLPDPRDPYAVSKLEAEQLVMQFCREHGLEWTIVRPVLVFGPGAGANFGQLMRLVARQIPLPLAAIRNARSFLYVDNLNAFLAEATRHPYLVGRSVNLADPPALSTPELIRKLSAAMGRRAVLLPVPPTLLEWAGALAGRTDAIRRITGSLQVDTDRLFEEMPWKPPVPWDEALRETTADVRRR